MSGKNCICSSLTPLNEKKGDHKASVPDSNAARSVCTARKTEFERKHAEEQGLLLSRVHAARVDLAHFVTLVRKGASEPHY